jgi:hypothetical protein
MRKLWLVSVLGAVGMLGATGVAEARLDPSFGQSGLVRIQPPVLSPWRDQYVREISAARNGGSFVLLTRSCTSVAGCGTATHLLRYGRNGALDPTFGGPRGYYELPPGGEGLPTLVADSKGRPVIAEVSRGRMIVRRLTRTGLPDVTFGREGAISFRCGCPFGSARLISGPRATLTAAFSEPKLGGESSEQSGTITRVFRLKANGSMDRRFGNRGAATIGLRGVGSYTASATTARGALYLGGSTCCGSALSGYVIRISRRGRIDGRFTTAARHAIRSLHRLHGFETPITALLLRRSGEIDLLGSADYDEGFILRLQPNGHLVRHFGMHGLRRLRLPIADAALGSAGATVAISATSFRGSASVMRIFPSGRLDPAFGIERIPGTAGDFGLSVIALDRRRARILDLGFKECRGFCAAEPKMAQYLEGRPQKRR